MKKLGKLKLNHLMNDELSEREMTVLRGGENCSCGCHYADSGGSDFCTNGYANIDYGYTSYGGGTSCAPCYHGNEATDFAFWTGC